MKTVYGEEMLNKNIKNRQHTLRNYISFKEKKIAAGRCRDPVGYKVFELTYYNSSRGRPKPLLLQHYIALVYSTDADTAAPVILLLML